MENSVYVRFTADEVVDKEMDLGIAEDIKAQFTERHKSVGVLSNKEYFFISFDPDAGNHDSLYKYLVSEVEDAHYLISVDHKEKSNNMGISIMNADNEHFTSDFEKRVLAQFIKEVGECDSLLPEGIESSSEKLADHIKWMEREEEKRIREKEKQEMAEKKTGY